MMIKYMIEYSYWSTGSMKCETYRIITSEPGKELHKLIDVYAECDSFFGKFLLDSIKIYEVKDMDEST